MMEFFSYKITTIDFLVIKEVVLK